MRSFAAPLFCANDQMPQKYGRAGTSRPLAPFGVGNVQQSAATSGASRLATAQADGGFQIIALLPEIRARLFEASSQLTESGDMNCTSFLAYSMAIITLSLSIVMLPLASTRSAPNAPT